MRFVLPISGLLVFCGAIHLAVIVRAKERGGGLSQLHKVVFALTDRPTNERTSAEEIIAICQERGERQR